MWQNLRSRYRSVSQHYTEAHACTTRGKNDITTSILSDSYKLLFDGEGRICIPNELLKFANIKNQATFVGRGSSFQIWNPILFKNYLEKARNNIKKKKLSLVIKNTNNDKK